MKVAAALRSLLIVALLAPVAACLGTKTEPPGSFMSRGLGFTGQRGEVDADMLIFAASHMAKNGSVQILEDTVKSGEVAVGIYSRSGNQKGVFRARMLQADALIHLGRTKEAEVAIDQSAAAAQAAKCPSCTAEMHVRRSQIDALRHEWPKATANLEIAATILETNRELAQAARVRLIHSSVLSQSGDAGDAGAMAKEAERLSANAGDKKLMAQAHVQLANLATERQDTAKAIEHLDLATRKYAETGAGPEQVSTLCRIVRLSNPFNDVHQVKARLTEAEAVARAEKDAGNRVRQWLMIGEEYDRLGESDTAMARFAEAERIYKDANQPTGLAALEFFHISRALGERDYEEVEKRLAVARKYLAMKASPAGRKSPLVGLAMPQWKVEASLDLSEGALLVYRKMHQEALEPLTKVAERAERWNDVGLLATAQSLRGDAFVQLSRFDEAEQALQTASKAFLRDGKIDAAKRVELALALLRARNSASG